MNVIIPNPKASMTALSSTTPNRRDSGGPASKFPRRVESGTEIQLPGQLGIRMPASTPLPQVAIAMAKPRYIPPQRERNFWSGAKFKDANMIYSPKQDQSQSASAVRPTIPVSFETSQRCTHSQFRSSK